MMEGCATLYYGRLRTCGLRRNAGGPSDESGQANAESYQGNQNGDEEKRITSADQSGATIATPTVCTFFGQCRPMSGRPTRRLRATDFEILTPCGLQS